MGNTLSSPEQQHALANIISSASSSTSADADVLRVQAVAAAVVAASTSPARPPTQPHSSKKTKPKFHCRWCAETFDRKFSKDRHEMRKHSVELATVAGTTYLSQPEGPSQDSAAAASFAQAAEQSCSRKRSAASAGWTQSELERGEGSQEILNTLLDSELRSEAEESQGVLATKRARTATAHPTNSTSQQQPELQLRAGSDEPEEHDMDAAQLQAEEAMDDEFDQLQKLQEDVQSGHLFLAEVHQELEATDAQISTFCTPFLSWLCTSAVTESERTIKARRMEPAALPAVKKNLAFIIKTVLGAKMLEPSQQPSLEMFAQEKLCQQFNTFLEEREVGASRIYALFLLIKKILVYLTSSEISRRQVFLLPNTWGSWVCVDSICSDSNTRRKQLSQNRKVLGTATSKHLDQLQGRARTIPNADDLQMPAMLGEKKKKSKLPATAAQQQALVPATTAASTSAPDPNEMTPEELKIIAQGCLNFLRGAAGRGSSTTVLPDHSAYMATAFLCFGTASRQQELRQLQIGSSFTKKDDGLYWLTMTGGMLKNGKAIQKTLAPVVTADVDFYLQHVRPQLLGSQSHNYVFCKRSGDPPGEAFDFSAWTRKVCQNIIGRPINAHAFRGGVVTGFHQSGATQSEMNALSNTMGHSPATASAHYYRADKSKELQAIHERMSTSVFNNLQQEEAVEGQQQQTSVVEEQPGDDDSPVRQEAVVATQPELQDISALLSQADEMDMDTSNSSASPLQMSQAVDSMADTGSASLQAEPQEEGAVHSSASVAAIIDLTDLTV